MGSWGLRTSCLLVVSCGMVGVALSSTVSAGRVERARIVLAQGENRTFDPYDRFAQFRESEGKTLADLLDEFEALRVENLQTLRAWDLNDVQMALVGEHPAFGAVTLRQLLATWTAHDLGHLAQIARVMAQQYREAVGPWRQYLSVMER